MPFLETSPGVEIYYEETGHGRPLVMLHGWAMSGRVWQFQRELAASCRLLLPDLAGHGRSSAPPAGLTLSGLVNDICQLFNQLGLTDAVLLGWSLGSQVALASFPRLRERLAGLVLVGATPRFTATDGYPHGLVASELKGMGLRLKRNYNKTMGEFFRGMFAPGELSREQEERIAREIVMGGHLPEQPVAMAALDILAATDLRQELLTVDRPILLLHGSTDPICPVGAARFLCQQLPQARLKEFAGIGHAPFLSRPADFNAELRRSLKEELNGRH